MSTNSLLSFLINGDLEKFALNSLHALSMRANLEPLFESAERMSFDTYIFIRNFYLAKRSLGFSLSEEEED
jgi:ABC-type transporter lipoprotein component MlaA